MAVDQDQLSNGRVVPALERVAVTLIVAAFGLVMVWDGNRQIAESSYFPVVVGAALVLLSIFSLIGVRKQSVTTDEAPLVKGLTGLVLFALFIALAGNIGFLTTAIILIPAMAYLGGERNFVLILISVLAFDVAAYLVFNLLFSHPFPRELILGG